MKLLCALFGHDWGEWNSPVTVIERDGLDVKAVDGSQRKCKRCSEWDSVPRVKA